MSDAPTFGTRLTGLLVAAAIALAGLFAVLTAYAPDLGNGQDGGAHALSNAATGFSGIVQLARATGTPVSLSRNSRSLADGGLLILTIPPDVDPGKVKALIDIRIAQAETAPVLIILPKWLVSSQPFHPGWVDKVGVLPGNAAAAPVQAALGEVIERSTQGSTCCITEVDGPSRFPVPAEPQVLVTGDNSKLEPILRNANGGVVMGWSRSREVYVLADPDLLNNHGIKNPATAAAALALLREMAQGGPLTFDLTLNGFEHTRNLARLAFEPPFLALTLSLLAAAALVGWQAVIRFGTPRTAPRAIAFGKRALVDNAAMLIRSARREPAMAPRYARQLLDAAGAARGVPANLPPSEAAAWLDRRATHSEPYAALAAAADSATTRDAVLKAARALHAWQEDVTHDR